MKSAGHSVKPDRHANGNQLRILHKIMCGCIWTRLIATVCSDLVLEHDCERISGFFEQSDRSSPRAPMGFRALLPHCSEGFGRSVPNRDRSKVKVLAARQIRCLTNHGRAMTPQSQNALCLKLYDDEQG